MKLKTALEIGKDCGLDDIGEAVYNIQLHAGNIFLYEEISNELNELITEVKERKVSYDDKIDYWLEQL